jgi:hypothetical protein
MTSKTPESEALREDDKNVNSDSNSDNVDKENEEKFTIAVIFDVSCSHALVAIVGNDVKCAQESSGKTRDNKKGRQGNRTSYTYRTDGSS